MGGPPIEVVSLPIPSPLMAVEGRAHPGTVVWGWDKSRPQQTTLFPKFGSKLCVQAARLSHKVSTHRPSCTGCHGLLLTRKPHPCILCPERTRTLLHPYIVVLHIPSYSTNYKCLLQVPYPEEERVNGVSISISVPPNGSQNC
jgi:hypothetical protein